MCYYLKYRESYFPLCLYGKSETHFVTLPVCDCMCVCVPTVRVSAHGEVQHGVAELVLCLLLQLLTQTLQGSLVLCNTNSSQLQSVGE